MMIKNTELQVSEIINSLSQSGQEALGHYSHWFTVSALSWIAVGLVFLYAAYLNFKHRWAIGYPKDELPALPAIVTAIIGMIGVLIIGGNIPDLFAPQGIAIHQLIRDIRGQ